jgi:peptide/nickel transport system permease protein
MFRFAVKRLLHAFPTLVALSFFVFLWLRLLPGGPALALLGDKATPERVADLNRTMGLDQPLYIQYARFLGRVLHGDFGYSLVSTEAVATELSRAFPATLELSAYAMVFALGVGVPLGYLAGRRRGSLLDHLTVVGTLLGVAIPVFFLGILLKQVFAEGLGWLPPSGRQDVGLTSTTITGITSLDAVMTREWDVLADALVHLALPAIVLGTIPLAIVIRITRAAVAEVSTQDHVRTAEAKGLRSLTIHRRHILRNALLPISTTVGIQTGLLLAGAVLTEKVFVWRGLGSLLAEGIERRDYPRLQALILLTAVVFVVVNLLVDLSYALIDPRVRLR